MLEHPKSRGVSDQYRITYFYVLASDFVNVINFIISLRDPESHEFHHLVGVEMEGECSASSSIS